MRLGWGLAILSCAALVACASPQMAARVATELVPGQVQAMHEEADPVFAEQAMPGSLKMLEGLRQTDPANPEVLHRLAEGYCGYAFSFVEDRDPARASALYRRGWEFALQMLDAGERLRPDSPGFDKAVESADAGSVPALYWATQCWAGWLLLNLHEPSALAGIARLEKLILRIVALDETYYHAGPHLLAGAFYGGRTKVLGGNPEKAKSHFERALALTQDRFLMAHVLYAKTYAVQYQNRELFQSLLDRVLNTSSDILPQRRLANEVAKVKARKLLASADELF